MTRFRRLARMGLGEIAGRARQEAFRWLERRGMAPIGRSPLRPGNPGSPPVELMDPGESQSLLPGAADPASAPTVMRRFPDAAERTILQADLLLSGRFDLLRHRDLFFGDPMDWHLDPVSGRRARLVHWTRLAPLDPVPGGDPKVIWELNRHQWMITLGQAWRITGDSRYAESVAGAMRGWLKANPPGWGINWASSLEVALRLISWGWALALLRTSHVMTPELERLVAGAMAVHARHVERNLSRYFSPNTHLTGEALGLSHAAAFLPRLPRSRAWKEISDRILRHELGRQVLPDGVYFEQSTCYQRYTIEFYIHHLLLRRRTGAGEPPEAAGRIQAMLDFLLALSDDRGTIPQIGDGDSGKLLPLTPGPPEDVRPLFAVAASLFQRQDYAWAAGGEACAEVVWLLGPEGLAAFEAIAPSPPSRPASRLFPDGGYAVLGAGWEPGAPRMVVDVGHLGSPAGPGHGHADALSVQCWAHGEPYLADPGTYCYTTEPHWRDHFRGAGAHSTLLVDGRGAASPAGPFSWGVLPTVRLRDWRSDAILDVVDAEHDGFRGLEDPVVHRRRVAFVKPGYWVIVDDLSGAGSHQLELRFQLHPDRRLALLPAQWAAATGSEGRGLLLRCFATIPLSTQVHCGELAPPHGWFSPGLGRRMPAPVLVWSSLARLPARLITLVMPAVDVTARPPHVSPLMNEGPRLVGLVLGDGEEFVIVNDTDILLERRDATCAASRAS